MRFGLTLFLILVLFAGEAPAQTAMGSGTVRGVVRDSYGEGLPDAVVTLTNEYLGFRRVMETTLDGLFDAPWVIPSAGYRIQVTRKEYAGWESPEFHVPSAGTVVFEIRLPETGENSSGVKPTGRIAAPSETGISALFTRRSIEALPIAHRNLEALAALAPGVVSVPNGGRLAFFGQGFPNPLQVEGVNVENSLSDLSSGFGRRINPDSAQDLEIFSGDLPAWAGGSAGGVLSTAVRSGSNRLHGSFYEYFRTPGLEAADRFSGGRKLAGRRHQVGGSLSGPIMKDRWFFFADIEGRDAHSYAMNRILDPLISDASGNRVALANCEAEPARCAAAADFIQPRMNVLVPAPYDSLAGSIKFDWNATEQHAFRFAIREGRWNWPQSYRTEVVVPNSGAPGHASLETRTGFYKLGWTAALGRFAANDLGFGFFRDRLQQSTPAIAPGLRIRVGSSEIGASQPWSFSRREARRAHLGEHLRFTTGGHTFQIGAEWAQTRNRILEAYEAEGAYFYPSLTEFARDLGGGVRNYTWFTQTFGNAARDLLVKDWVVYGQHTWRFHRFTFNLGVRWDKPVHPQPLFSDSFFWQTRTVPSPSTAVAPRIGAAYAIDNDTVVRFSYGHYFASFTPTFVDSLWLGNGVYQTRVLVNPSHSGAPVYPAAIASSRNIPAGTKEVVYALAKLRHPYLRQTTVSVERRVAPELWVSARYVSSAGRRLLTAKDANLGQPLADKTYSILTPGGFAAGSFTSKIYTSRISTGYSRVFEIDNLGSSSFHALLLQARKAFSRGLSAEAGYTWSHAIDNVSGPWVIPSVPASTVSGELKSDRGSSNFDQRHRLVLSWQWEPALPSNAPRLAQALLNGWQQSAIVVLAASLPATPLVAVRGQQFAGTTMLYTNTLNGSGGWARVPFLPVNHYRAEPLYNVDARLSRTISFAEIFTARLSFEAFNLFNTRSATALNTTAYVAVGGALRPVAGAGSPNAAVAPRSVQLAVRLEF